jgi:lactoylglutathione lyase
MTAGSLIKGIAHLGIRVWDLTRSRAFYERMGFEFIAGPIGPEPVAIMTHPSGVVVNFILNAAASSSTNVLMDVPEKHPGYTHFAFAVTDVLAMKSALEQAGITLSGGPVDFESGSRSIFVRDPDRNVIEFTQELE